METSPTNVPLRPGESSLIDGTAVHAIGNQKFTVVSQTGFSDHPSAVDVSGEFATGHYVPGGDGNPVLEIFVYETIL